MSYHAIINLSLSLATAALAASSILLSLVYTVWAVVGRDGEPRARRLRIGLVSFLIFVASVLTGISIFYLVTMPGTMKITRPDFKPPHEWFRRLLALAGPISIFTAVGLAAAALRRQMGDRRRLWLASLGCLLLFAAVSGANYGLIYAVQVPAYERYVAIESRDWRTRVGDQAPNIKVAMLNGSPVQLSDLRGKVVLLNFFATWCGPCLKELPHLQALWNEQKSNDDFRMLVVNRQESPETVKDFQSKNGFSFPIAVDPDATAFNQFAKESIPRTYLIARNGTIVFQTLGYGEMALYQREMKTLRRLIAEELKN
jgi:peroxiredoxin